jgi:pimeloyl-ACP methyl ester carboxylesterase
MDADEPQFLEVGEGAKTRHIAYRFADRNGREPVLLWLPGFLADMAGSKAVSLAAFAETQGLPMLRFDYSGHGLSPGNMLDAAIGDWLEEAGAVLRLAGKRRVILVGSSMGGWIALLLARILQQAKEIDRLAGLVLLAPAFDMTERLMWRKLSPKTKAIIETEGVFYAPSLYGDPYPLTKRLIEEGRNHLIGEGAGPLHLGLPIRILQGMEDPDVPWGHALDLIDLLSGDDVVLTLVKDGDHRLSRPQDIRRLELTVAALVETVQTP